MQKLIDKLVELDACSEAIIWVKEQVSLKSAWENCNNFEWLHWLLNQLGFAEQILSLRVAYDAAFAQAWAAYYAAIAPARAAYYAAVAQAEVAYNAAIAQAWAAYVAAVDPINCEFCNQLREIVSFEDVLKL